MLPHFLGIGAPRTGTTWIHLNFRRHPDIWVPPVKEIHYFDEARLSLARRLFGRSDAFRRSRGRLRTSALNWQSPESREDAKWFARFVLMPRNDRWYECLFPAESAQTIGEITPAYGLIGEETIAHVYRMMPNVKLFYTARDPIETIWSLMTRGESLKRWGPVEKWPQEMLRAKVVRWNKVGDHGGNYERWRKYYPADRLLLGFFEDFSDNPAAFLRTITDHLNVDPLPDRRVRSKRAHARQRDDFPPDVARVIARHQMENIERAHRVFANDYTAAWLERAKNLV